MMGFLESVQADAAALEGWLQHNGWKGFDPYDIRGHDLYVRFLGAGSACPPVVRKALRVLEKRLPQLGLRKALRIEPQINAKGMGLLASAHIARYRNTARRENLVAAEATLAWLTENACRAYPGMSWGYPFHWQSRLFIPRGTPSIVVTSVVGNAYLDHYEATRERVSLEMVREVARFILQGLNRPVDSADMTCFSYTPIDSFKVHNASLFGAALLARLSALTGEEEFGHEAIRAVRYTLSEQRADGAFYYWGSEAPNTIDHYHTGFVLRHLETVERSSRAGFIGPQLERGYGFYLRELFDADGTPRFSPDSAYPLNIHSCAEALICLAQLSPKYGGGHLQKKVFRVVRNRMRTAEGWYLAEIERYWWGERKVRIPYLRWGQAWMFLALARLEQKLITEGK